MSLLICESTLTMKRWESVSKDVLVSSNILTDDKKLSTVLETEIGGFQIWGNPRLRSITLSQKQEPMI